MPLNPFEMERDALLDYVGELFADNTTEDITPEDARHGFQALIYSMLVKSSDGLSVNQLRGGTHIKASLVARDAIAFERRVLGMSCVVANPVGATELAAGVVLPPATFVLARDSSGGVTAFLDADTGATGTGRWVLASGTEEEKIASYPEFVEEDHPYKKDDPIQYTFPDGRVRLFKARKDLSDYVNPAPTGQDNDPNWVPFAPLESGSGLTAAQAIAYVLDALGRGLKRWPGRGPVGITQGDWWLFTAGIFEAKNDFTAIYQPSGTDADWQAVLYSGSWAIDQLAPSINAAANAPQPPVVAYHSAAVEVYRGTNLANALAATGIYGDVRINSKLTLTRNATLAAGTYLDGSGIITDLGGYTLFVREGSRISDLVAQNGRLEVTGQGGTYLVGGYLPGLTIHVPVDKMLTLESVQLTGNTFSGGGKVILLGTSKLPLGTTIRDNTEVVPAPGGQTYSAGNGIAISPAGVISATGTGTTNPGTPSPSTGPRTFESLNAAATLQADKSYLVSGSGYALTLPDPADVPGQALLVAVAASATNLYPLTGSPFTLRRGEAIELLSTGTEWVRQGGNWQPAFVQLRNSGSDYMLHNTTSAISFDTVDLDNTAGAYVGSRRIVAARKAQGFVSVTFFLINGQIAPDDMLVEAKLYCGSTLFKADMTIKRGSGKVVATYPVALEAGQAIELHAYCYDYTFSGNSLGQTAPGECLLSYTENLQ